MSQRTLFPDVATSRDAAPRERLGGWQAGALALAWHGTLWLLLAGVSAAVLFSDTIPIAVRNPLAAVAIATTAGVVGLAIFQLGVVRFSTFGHPFDLLAGIGFGLAAVQLLVGVLGPLFATSVLTPNARLAMLVVGRTVTGVLFVLGLFYGAQPLPLAARRGFRRRLGLGVGIILLAILGTSLTFNGQFPPLFDPRTRDMLEQGQPVYRALPGQSLPLVILTGANAMLLLVAAVGYVDLSRRLGDSQIGWLAAAMSLLFFSRVHEFLFPPATLDYVSTADGFRTGAYAVLLFSLVTRLNREIAERVSRDERLRLSRELHDGLAQELGLLNLALSRAAAPTRSPEARARDLERAKRLVEAASLEAREAITALRTGVLTWAEFTRTVGTFLDEFGTNHEVDVRLSTDGTLPSVEAEVQAEILRILHEALSNAVRHGGASRVDVKLLARGVRLELEIHDNGSGFDTVQTLQTGSGVGLRSMRERIEQRAGRIEFDSSPERGTTVRALLPVAAGPRAAAAPV